ncbi:hypothetical protein PR048_032319 [Dryococelus australis]|uniref:Uncharacterized protein n=1 Tax=Dryococelus australis TaxID=614101 RepID=A0ABQ9G616_9NEOP|nr:hypothetical protein PR048_032319 [Dryococelus australis]
MYPRLAFNPADRRPQTTGAGGMGVGDEEWVVGGEGVGTRREAVSKSIPGKGVFRLSYITPARGAPTRPRSKYSGRIQDGARINSGWLDYWNPPRRTGFDFRDGVAPGFLHVDIVLNDAVGRRVFSVISRFPPARAFRRCCVLSPLHIGSQNLDVKRQRARSSSASVATLMNFSRFELFSFVATDRCAGDRLIARVGWTPASEAQKRGCDTGDTNTHY